MPPQRYNHTHIPVDLECGRFNLSFLTRRPSTTVDLKPDLVAHRWYILRSISAQSCTEMIVETVIMDGNLEPLLTAYLMFKQSSASAGGHRGYCHSARKRILLLLLAHREERPPGLLRHCELELLFSLGKGLKRIAGQRCLWLPRKLTSAKAGEGDKEFWLGSYDPILTLEGFTRQELLDLDNEGRCIVTDHGYFVLFNIYGPNVGCGDVERQDFMLQCRLESILKQGRRIIIVGDLNISPYPINSCDPGPEFDTNPSRQWFRSLLVSEVVRFQTRFACFILKEAYTCWSQASGAEEFNYGSRIDHVLIAGPCAGHYMCDILLEFKRAKLDTLPRWSGGRSLKLDGSDHAPVILQFKHLPSIPPHEAPQLAAHTFYTLQN
ncbi:hypothetical protein SELMODRAFT_430260 [Selaginella moellendorffii]|uniref:Endonuclease/exonuclease/phosphatase domain-containing protein n=1 Tax=Selaginella moellendorffii TaxID=88036 RepID=D8T8V3_SELML|nr:hypothetical protein SELMODRAFT_430260 [Selaginella moellendorffii]